MTALLLTPGVTEGPSLGHGPLLTARFATGREFAVIRAPGMCFTVRWREPIPGFGTLFVRRRSVGKRHPTPVFGVPPPKPRSVMAWGVAVGWVRGPYCCYVYPPDRFPAWKDALGCGLSWLDAWLTAPCWRTFQNESYGGIGPRSSLDAMIDAFGLEPVPEAGEEDES